MAQSKEPSAAEVAATHLQQAGFNRVPDGWTVVSVKDILAAERGISVGVMYPGAHDPLGIPLIKAGDLSGNRINPSPEFSITSEKHQEYRRTELSGGEILLTLVGEIGLCAIVPPSMSGWNVARAVAMIRLADPTDATYVRLCLMSKPLQHLMDVWATTTVQATLNLKEIRELPLPWPPKAVRDSIGANIDVIDRKINLNRQMNENLLALAQATFLDWFVDYGPVINRGDRTVPISASDLFPMKLNVDRIPEGWRSQRLSECIEIISGGTPKTSVPEYWGGDIPWFSVVDTPLPSDVFVISTEKQITKTGLDSSAAKVLPLNATIITARGTVGKLALVGSPMAMNQSCYAITGKEGLSPYFLFFLLKFAVDELKSKTHGSVFDTITRATFDSVTAILPPVQLAQAFDEIIAPLMARIKANLHETRTLSSIRDLVLPKLLSGDLTVNEGQTP